MSLLRSHICKFIIGVIFIFAISPIPALLLHTITPIKMDLLAFFKTSHSFLLYQFQRLIGCMNLSFSQQTK